MSIIYIKLLKNTVLQTISKVENAIFVFIERYFISI